MLLTACIHALFSWSSWDVALFTAQGCRAFFKYFFFQNLFPLPIYDLNSTVNQGDFLKKIFFQRFAFAIWLLRQVLTVLTFLSSICSHGEHKEVLSRMVMG